MLWFLENKTHTVSQRNGIFFCPILVPRKEAVGAALASIVPAVRETAPSTVADSFHCK